MATREKFGLTFQPSLEMSKNPSKITDRKPYFSGILETEFEVSENISFL